MGDYLIDVHTVGMGGMQATVRCVRAVMESERNALEADDGAVIFNCTSGVFWGRAGCI